jgi:hypothetical protein
MNFDCNYSEVTFNVSDAFRTNYNTIIIVENQA